jgi:glycosyltransferase involved in cell wall biosynthesis
LALYGLSVRYIGHGVVDNTRDKRVRKVLKFLHVAGTNAVTRKNTIQVVQAFKQCQNPNITLTVTIEKNIPDGIEEMCQDPRITLILEHLDHSDIIRLYQESHVSIQVSSHEGIGLGFYESISCSTPVISLDAAPHNEVVIEGKTGWLISCYPIILTDNPQAIIMGSSFNVRDLSDKIDYLSHNLSLVNQVITRTTQTYREKFSEKILANRLINELF